QLDAGTLVESVNSPDRFGVQPGASVLQVVACDSRDRRVLQPHRSDGFGDPARLVRVELGGLAGVDLAEVAAARALRAADEESGFTVFPAFEDIGAAGFFAYRMQPGRADEVLHVLIVRTDLRL